MKRFMVIGKSGCGKTSLLQRLFGEDISYRKTQTVEHFYSAIDTPGEYLEHKGLYNALIVSAMDADELILIQAADDPDSSFPPYIGSSFNCPLVGVVTKTDLCTDSKQLENAAASLKEAGAETIYFVSATSGEGIEELKKYIH